MILAALLAVAAAPAADTVDVSVRATVGRPLLVSLEAEHEGNVTLTLPTGPTDRRLSVRRSLRVVDEFQRVEEDRWEATRRFVRWFREEDGAVRDPEANGLTFRFQQRDGRGDVQCADDRAIRTEFLDRLLDQIGSVGLYLHLPSEATALEPFAFDGSSVASFLLGLSGELVDAKGALQLEGLDEAGLATLRGKLLVRERQEQGTLRFDSRYDGDLTVVIDTTAHRVARIAYRGRSSAAGGEGSIGVDARGRFTIEVEAADASKGEAAEAADAPAVQRDVVRALDGLGVTVTLPSHWFPVDTEQGAGFVSSLLGDDEAGAYLEVFRLDVPADQVDAAYRRARESVTGDGEAATLEDVRSPLGHGVKTMLSLDGLFTHVEIYPLPTALIRVRLQGTEDVLDEALEQYESIRASLRPIGAAPER